MSLSLFSLVDAQGPAAALEITGERVCAARLELRGGTPTIAAHAGEALPPGAVVPALTGTNVHNRPVVAAAVAKVLERIGGPRRVGLILADPVSKVSLLRFQQVPARAGDLDQVVRWQVKKTAPFPLEEAQLAFVPAATLAGAREFLVSLIRKDVIAEYEGLCTEAGAHPGVVDISSFNVINAILAAGGSTIDGDWLLVNAAADWTSLAIVRRGDVIFYRGRAAEGDGTLADLVHQTAMYYEDRLSGAGFRKVIVCGATAMDGGAHALGTLRDTLGGRLESTIETADLSSTVTFADRITADAALADSLVPVVGLLLRSRAA